MFLYNKCYLKIAVFAWLMFYIFLSFQVNAVLQNILRNI
jgi:hypothetical protein